VLAGRRPRQDAFDEKVSNRLQAIIARPRVTNELHARRVSQVVL
jgi:hypothetical protein